MISKQLKLLSNQLSIQLEPVHLQAKNQVIGVVNQLTYNN